MYKRHITISNRHLTVYNILKCTTYNNVQHITMNNRHISYFIPTCQKVSLGYGNSSWFK